MIQDKINNYIHNSGEVDAAAAYALPSNWHSIAGVNVDGVNAEKSDREVQDLYRTPLLRPTKSRPTFYILNNTIQMRPAEGVGKVYVIRKPTKPSWAYVIVGEKPMYDPSRSVDFDMHVSEEKDLVVKIAQLCGVAIQDYNLAQAAGAKEMNIVQQEKS